jgi:ABC-2 type transport system ATP-binding protein
LSTLETHSLTRRFGDEVALAGLSIEAEPGEVVALLGPNGAGKTTTVRLLNGVLAPDAGEARVLGLDPATQGNELRRLTGVLTENAGLDDRLTSRENLLAAARIRGLDHDSARQRIDEQLERFAMSDRADSLVQGFSTGQRKRLARARALLHAPQGLVRDEPTTGLAPAATRDVVDLIAGLAGEHGRTVLLCTHFLGEAGRLAHRMAVLDRGHLVAFGRPSELAATLWRGMVADLDLGGPLRPDHATSVRALRGVLDVEPTPLGAEIRVESREVLPMVVATLVGAEVPVFGATPREATLEDVYFEILDRR